MDSFFQQHRVLLAPMAGVSDPAFRMICLEQGADLAYTEMVSAKGLSFANEKTRSLIELALEESLVAVQIFGHEPSTMAQEASWIEDQLQDRLAYIDINMGCPAKKIVRKGDGCALMQDPTLARSIISEVSKAIQHPVTVKFRRGFSIGEETALSFALMAEDAGAAAVTIHGRFAEQLYRGRSDWQIIAQVKEAISIPVIGNGDITSSSDALKIREVTACDGIMVGRAAQGNPWVFSDIKAAFAGMPAPKKPNAEERVTMALRHAASLDAQGGKSLVRMRKHAMWYLSGLPGASSARKMINSATTLQDFEKVFGELLAYDQKDKAS